MQKDGSLENFENSKEKVASKIEEELRSVMRINANSILQRRDFDALSNVNFKEIVEEMKRLCPTLYELVYSMLEMDINAEKKIPTMALIYSLTMFKRFHGMSLLQRLNTLLLIDGDTNQEVNNEHTSSQINI